MIPLKQSVTVSALLLFVLVALVGIFAFEQWYISDKPPRTYPGTLTTGETTINIDIARTEAARMRGLSGQKFLPENAGMLFVFGTPGIYPVWMKDMLFHIDVIWIDKDGVIVGIDERLSPKSYPKAFPPPAPIKYILEVNTGFVRTNSVIVGDIVSFSGSLIP